MLFCDAIQVTAMLPELQQIRLLVLLPTCRSGTPVDRQAAIGVLATDEVPACRNKEGLQQRDADQAGRAPQPTRLQLGGIRV